MVTAAAVGVDISINIEKPLFIKEEKTLILNITEKNLQNLDKNGRRNPNNSIIKNL